MQIENELEQNLISHRDSVLIINRHLNSYQLDIKSLMSSISKKSFEDSQEDFDNLHKIQTILSVMQYKYHFDLPENLKMFLYDFDRDDMYSRRHWYKKINKIDERK